MAKIVIDSGAMFLFEALDAKQIDGLIAMLMIWANSDRDNMMKMAEWDASEVSLLKFLEDEGYIEVISSEANENEE